MDDAHDPVIERAADTLRAMPHVDLEAKARVLVAVAAERARGDSARQEVPARGRLTRAWVSAVAAALILVVGTTMVNLKRSGDARVSTASEPVAVASASGVRAAATDEDAVPVAMVPVQLVFRAPTAARVDLVGDFTGWDASRAPMTRDPESGLWSVTVSMAPGRHVYAYIVDDSIWTRDPRAMVADDADYNRAGSLLLVGRQ